MSQRQDVIATQQGRGSEIMAVTVKGKVILSIE
jgi:hypothetical protein